MRKISEHQETGWSHSPVILQGYLDTAHTDVSPLPKQWEHPLCKQSQAQDPRLLAQCLRAECAKNARSLKLSPVGNFQVIIPASRL